MKTFCFKLYKSARNAKLHKQINAAGLTFNHCYKFFGKFLNRKQCKMSSKESIALLNCFSLTSSAKYAVRHPNSKNFVATNLSR